MVLLTYLLRRNDRLFQIIGMSAIVKINEDEDKYIKIKICLNH